MTAEPRTFSRAIFSFLPDFFFSPRCVAVGAKRWYESVQLQVGRRETKTRQDAKTETKHSKRQIQMTSGKGMKRQIFNSKPRASKAWTALRKQSFQEVDWVSDSIILRTEPQQIDLSCIIWFWIISWPCHKEIQNFRFHGIVSDVWHNRGEGGVPMALRIKIAKHISYHCEGS